MSILTHSRFNFGHVITSANNALDFSEGAGELQATLDNGSFTLEEYASEIKLQLDNAGALTYTVTVDRTTRLLTIAATGTFSLLVSTGTRSGTATFSLAGFTGSDRTAAATYEGDSESGDTYTTQFILQSFIDSVDLRTATDATVNKSASGRVEVFKYGNESFFELDIKFATDIAQPLGGPIRNNATGIADLRTFMRAITEKSRFEFMKDENIPTTFSKVILESTREAKDGTGYKLRERFDRGLPGYFDTGALKLRVIT